ncbi:MAG TPA: hypothetical protein VMM78_03570 [Thermomicrobiales bacterium]|nr:hypothetical protein [Thermomicrobiales bacterium]
MIERDYSKFLKDDARLNMRLIPRDVWVEMIKHARQRDDFIEIVLEEMYWLWDLNELIAKAQSEGRVTSRAELLDEIMAEMGDSDWWKLMSAFEEHIMRSFSTNPGGWAEYLDPVYDLQEREGWQHRQ